VNWLVNTASVLLAGVFYPTEVLPEALQALGRVLPMTHALEIVRRSLLGGEGIDTLLPSFVALVALTAVYLPLGILACHWAVRVAQTDGSLTAY
jgi:ABC-2 type transport system permease protein